MYDITISVIPIHSVVHITPLHRYNVFFDFGQIFKIIAKKIFKYFVEIRVRYSVCMFRYNSISRQQYHKPDIDSDFSTLFQKTLSLNSTKNCGDFLLFY